MQGLFDLIMILALFMLLKINFNHYFYIVNRK